jgi:hypothetical protein
MITRFFRIKSYIIYLIGIFLITSIFFRWTSYSADDLLEQLIEPAQQTDTIINLGENVKTVWNSIIGWSTEISIDWIGNNWSLIIRITRFILILTIALAVTMILYNWFLYIVQSWKWEDWKKHITNVMRIIVWILIALFSVIIINLIQSIPKTLDEELVNKSDLSLEKEDKQIFKEEKDLIKWKKINWNDVGAESLNDILF